MTQRQTRLIILLIVLTPPAFVLCLLRPAFLKKDNPGFFARENITAINGALSAFRTTCGSLPTGDSATVFRSLLGNNPVHQPFLIVNKTNAAGEILDSWGTPYQIQIEGGTNAIIRSAGKDRVFGDSDDIVYDSAKRDFVAQP